MLKRLFRQGCEHRFDIVRHGRKRRVFQVFAFHGFVQMNLINLLLPGRLPGIIARHFFKILVGHDGPIVFQNIFRCCKAVILFQKQPGLLILARFNQREFPLQLFSVQNKRQMPFFQSLQKKLFTMAFPSGSAGW